MISPGHSILNLSSIATDTHPFLFLRLCVLNSDQTVMFTRDSESNISPTAFGIIPFTSKGLPKDLPPSRQGIRTQIFVFNTRAGVTFLLMLQKTFAYRQPVDWLETIYFNTGEGGGGGGGYSLLWGKTGRKKGDLTIKYVWKPNIVFFLTSTMPLVDVGGRM